LHDAQEFLLMSKTRDGRLGLTEREERARVISEVAKDMLSRRPFSFYLGRYIAKYVDPMDDSNEVRKHSKGVVRARILGLKNVLLTWKPPAEKERTGLLAVHRAANSKSSKKPLGDFFLDEIDLDVANEFLTVRNTTHAASTVMRERGQLQTIWSKLRHLDPAQSKKLLPENPWQAADKALISVPDTTRERDLSDDEEDRMIASLAKCRNKLVPLVIGLALATGMRRGEILMLEWGQVQDGYLRLRAAQTKRGKVRHVMLTEDAREILAGLLASYGESGVKPDQRLFPMTINAFKKSWNAARRRAGLQDFRFHDTRRVAVTRMLRQMTVPSTVMISAMTGMQSVAHIEERFVQPFEDRERARTGRMVSEADLRANVGHADARMTKHYANLGPKPT
jgi:integrase